MKRKVIQIADSTQLVSLPRKWCLAHQVKKGDELQVDEEGNRLVIQTEKSPELGSVEANIGKLDRDSIMFLTRALYKNGYDEITIRFKEPLCENIRTGRKEKVVDVIAKEVSRLNGVEVFTQKEDYCVIKNISEDSDKAFDTMLRRIFLLTIEAFEDLIEGYKNKDENLLVSVQNKHDTITKFITYCQRLLNKVGYPNFKKTDVMFHVMEIIDSILDLLKYNARSMVANKTKASPQGIAVCKAIQKSFQLYYDLYYKFSLEKIYELNKNRYSVLKTLIAARNKINKNEFSILSNMEQVLEYLLNLTNARISLEY
jgi:phosphate uptake regulator